MRPNQTIISKLYNLQHTDAGIIQKNFSKKASSTMNAMIIIVSICMVCYLSYNLYTEIQDLHSREFCYDSGLINVKEDSSQKSYELKCKAKKYALSFDKISTQAPTFTKLAAYGITGAAFSSEGDRAIFNLKFHFASEMLSCWELTNAEDIVDFTSTPLSTEWWQGTPPIQTIAGWNNKYLIDGGLVPALVGGSEQRIIEKDRILRQYLGYDGLQENKFSPVEYNLTEGQTLFDFSDKIRSVDLQLPAISCIICSDTYLDKTTIKIFNKDLATNALPFDELLRKTPTSSEDKETLLTVLRKNKGSYPKYPENFSILESVVYYEYKTSVDEITSSHQSGIVLLPTKDVANFCDIIINQG